MAYAHKVQYGGGSIRNLGYWAKSLTESRTTGRSNKSSALGARSQEIVLSPGCAIAAGGSLEVTLDLAERGWSSAAISVACVFDTDPTTGALMVFESVSAGGVFSATGETRGEALYSDINTTWGCGFTTSSAATKIRVVNATGTPVSTCRITAIGIRTR